MPIIKALSTSSRKGVRKNNQHSCRLISNFGLTDDAHAGTWHRQVSLLAQESIDTMRAKGLAVVAGNFAENITTEGLVLTDLPVGSHLQLGDCELIVSQLGKICHHRCAIYHQAGDCVMPREGIFAVVHQGGDVRVGDPITVSGKRSTSAAVLADGELLRTAAAEIVASCEARFGAVFTRLEPLADGPGRGLAIILDDLCTSQQITNIVIVDPDGSLRLSDAGGLGQAKRYRRNNSTIHYCQNLDQLAG